MCGKVRRWKTAFPASPRLYQPVRFVAYFCRLLFSVCNAFSRATSSSSVLLASLLWLCFPCLLLPLLLFLFALLFVFGGQKIGKDKQDNCDKRQTTTNRLQPTAGERRQKRSFVFLCRSRGRCQRRRRLRRRPRQRRIANAGRRNVVVSCRPFFSFPWKIPSLLFKAFINATFLSVIYSRVQADSSF